MHFFPWVILLLTRFRHWAVTTAHVYLLLLADCGVLVSPTTLEMLEAKMELLCSLPPPTAPAQ